MRTRIHFDGDMRQPGKPIEPLLVDCRGLWGVGDDRGDHRGVARTHLPDMQVGDPVAADLDALANAVRKLAVGNGVEQHAAGGAERLSAQLAITIVPTSPTSGSMKVQPNTHAADSPTIAGTEVIASASTWT